MKALAQVAALSAALVAADPATASGGPPSTGEAHIVACLESAAKDFRIDALPLVILRQVEAGTVGKVSGNKNGSYDIGPMQINSSWLPRLSRLGISEDMVRDDACVNAYVGAWIFRAELVATGNDVAMAMARYHSRTERHQLRYLGLVRRVIERNLAKLPPPVTVTLAGSPPP